MPVRLIRSIAPGKLPLLGVSAQGDWGEFFGGDTAVVANARACYFMQCNNSKGGKCQLIR